MKKLFLRIGLIVLALVLVVFVVLFFFLGGIVKNRVQAIGPEMTQGPVTLDSAGVWFVPGHVQLKGVFVGNPPGYKSDYAIKLGEVSVRMNFLSALSDKVVVDQILMKSPEITLEGGLKKNNLTKIQKNMSDYVDSGSTPAKTPEKTPAATNSTPKPTKKYQVNDLTITGARLRFVSLLGTGKNVSITLPDIHLVNLGAGEGGITSPDIAKKALEALIDSISQNAGKEIEELSKEAESKIKNFDFKKAGDKMKHLFGQ